VYHHRVGALSNSHTKLRGMARNDGAQSAERGTCIAVRTAHPYYLLAVNTDQFRIGLPFASLSPSFILSGER